MCVKDDIYSGYTDEELIGLLRGGESVVCDLLLGKYMPLVRKRARLYYLEGGDMEDLLQEGMLGLFKAIREFEPAREASFYTFARLCINNQILSAIEAAGRKKHRALNESVSFEELPDINAGNLVAAGPETLLMEEESAQELLTGINAALSPMERRVLKLYLEGMNYRMIAEKMGIGAKSVDNALQRIKSKVKKYKKGVGQ